MASNQDWAKTAPALMISVTASNTNYTAYVRNVQTEKVLLASVAWRFTMTFEFMW
jgi:hypothetical protein